MESIKKLQKHLTRPLGQDLPLYRKPMRIRL